MRALCLLVTSSSLPLSSMNPARQLRLFIPSSSSTIRLEARIYSAAQSLPPSSFRQSAPLSAEEGERVIAQWFEPASDDAPKRLVVATHPYAPLGGNMLDPVLTDHLVPAALRHPRTAVLTYNYRGIGLSGGSRAWLGAGHAVADLEAVERWAVDQLKVEEVWRLGFSWGTMAAVCAAPTRLAGIMLVSPPISVFGWTAYFSSTSFTRSLKETIDSLCGRQTGEAVRQPSSKHPAVLIYGTRDEFTGAQAYRQLRENLPSLHMVEVEDGGHFYRSEQEGASLDEALLDWLGA